MVCLGLEFRSFDFLSEFFYDYVLFVRGDDFVKGFFGFFFCLRFCDWGLGDSR